MNDERRSILVGTDFSPASDIALKQADVWARREGLGLLVCHVLPTFVGSNPVFPERSAAQQQLLLDLQPKILSRVEQQVLACTPRSPGEFQTLISTGKPSSALLRVAETTDARGIVVGKAKTASTSHTSERVVRYASVQVLLAKEPLSPGHVLAATDLSDPSIPAILAGMAAAKERAARLTLLHCFDIPVAPIVDSATGMVWQPDFPKELIESKRQHVIKQLRSLVGEDADGIDFRCELGDATDTILRIADEEQSELIVLGSHGRTGLRRFVLGSVAEWILRAAPTSILVVRVGASSNA